MWFSVENYQKIWTGIPSEVNREKGSSPCVGIWQWNRTEDLFIVEKITQNINQVGLLFRQTSMNQVSQHMQNREEQSKSKTCKAKIITQIYTKLKIKGIMKNNKEKRYKTVNYKALNRGVRGMWLQPRAGQIISNYAIFHKKLSLLPPDPPPHNFGHQNLKFAALFEMSVYYYRW